METATHTMFNALTNNAELDPHTAAIITAGLEHLAIHNTAALNTLLKIAANCTNPEYKAEIITEIITKAHAIAAPIINN